MPFDPFKGILWNDGEGIEHGDLNVTSRYPEARLFDQVIRATAGNARAATDQLAQLTVSPAPFLYALGGGQGYIVPGAVALQTTVRGGVIFQQVGGVDGNAPTFLPYTMVDGSFTLTHAIGDATNPRIDVIEVKLELVDSDTATRDFEDATTEALTTSTPAKTRRVFATFQIKAGTPAASPTYPALTAGFAALGAVLVPATHNAVFTALAHMRDLRLPLRVRHVDVFPADFVSDGSTWSHSPNTALATHLQRYTLAQSLDGTFAVPCPLAASHRVIGFGLYGRFLATAAREVKLVRQQIVDPGSQTTFPETAILTELADLSAALLGASSTSWKWTSVGMDALEAALAAGPSPARNGSNLGDGVWGNGLHAGPSYEFMDVDPLPTDSLYRLVATVRCSTGVAENCGVVLARWYYLDGIA